MPVRAGANVTGCEVRPDPAGAAASAAATSSTDRRSAVRRWFDPTGRSWPARVFVVLVVLAALTTVAVGVRQPVELPAGGLPLPARVGIAAALAAAAQLARLRFRLGRRTVSVCGGEAAFLLGLALVPAGWLPAATLVGAAAAWTLISALSDHRPPIEIANLAASLTLGAAGAAAVATQVAGVPLGGAMLGGPTLVTSTPRLGLALLAGCGAHLLITVGLSVITLALHRDVPFGLAVLRTLHGRLPIFVGNVLLGLFTVLAIDLEPRWLLLVPPAGWLLHRGYRLHLRAEDERRLWPAFARSTRALDGASTRDVAQAGIRGAVEVFAAHRVRVTLLGPDGGRQHWTGDNTGAFTEGADRGATALPAAPAASQGAAPAATQGAVSDAAGEVADLGATPPGRTGSHAAARVPAPAVTRTLSAVGAPIGELALWLSPATPWSGRDDLAVAAYGDALANALHNAVTQEHLGAISARAAHQARHDPLTGLRNRAALLTEGDELLQAMDASTPVALLLLDLDDFSRVNATLGQHAGDKLLTVVGERLGGLAREHDLLARLGDDEFALLLPQVTVLSDTAAPLAGPSAPLAHALRRAHDLVQGLGAPVKIAGVRLSMEAAVGVVVEKAGCFDLVELLRRAEIALGAAKRSEAPVVAYDDGHDVASTDHLAMLAELRDALATDDQIVLALQPAVDLETGAPTGVEALSRWQHPRRGLLSPIEFIRVVEGSKLLGPFTRYVLDHSLAAAATWSAAGLDLPVSVNVAARSLLDPTFPAQVADALRRHTMPAHRLVLEITETMAVSEQPIVGDVVTALRQLGVQLSVDDFGTGYSSLSILKRMPVDELKVDRSFVAGMAESSRSASIVRFAVELGRSLDLRVVAEGVETAEQRAALATLGCTSAQGYHFCKPLPADRIVEALRSLSDGAPANVVPLRADGAS